MIEAIALNGIAGLVTELIKNTSSIEKSGDIEKLKKEEFKQKITLRMAQAQARVSQELAIAKRIETAAEVEIEEFYDNSGEGSIGAKGSQEGITLGVSGAGKKIVKRIYRFKGSYSKTLVEQKV